jgi:hypothetical protein
MSRAANLLLLSVVASLALIGTAHAQYSGLGCTWTASSPTVSRVAVYFNPGTLAANGFAVDRFRAALLDAMAVWNEESRSQIDLYYAGDTTMTSGIANAIVINHQNVWTCADNALAKAFYAGAGSCRTPAAGPIVHVILQDSCTATTRPWKTTWPGAGGSGGYYYESVLTHELGHMLSMPDVVSTTGTMNGVYTEHASTLHLYPIDQASALITGDGLTHRRPRTAASTDAGVTFGAQSLISGLFSATSPSLASANDLGLRASIWEMGLSSTAVRRGTHGSWTTITSPPNGGFGSASEWVSVSHASGGQTVLAWPTNCNNTAHCQIAWAFTANNGTSWTTGTLTSAGTYARVELAYDPFRDRFVMAYLDGDTSRIFMSSTAATAVAWTTPNVASQASTAITETFRYMGGLVFDSGGAGLLAAGTNSSYTSNPEPGQIVQMNTSVTGTTYTLGWAFWASSANPTWYITRRHFGLARNPAGTIVMGWRGPSGPRSFSTASKATLTASGGFGSISEPILDAVNSVDLAWSPISNAFIGGLSSP